MDLPSVVQCTAYFFNYDFNWDSFQVHGLLHLLGFDHELSEEAEAEMEKEEELLLNNLGWQGKGLIRSACDAVNDGSLHVKDPDGNSNLLLSFL